MRSHCNCEGTCRSKRRHGEEDHGGHKDGRLVEGSASTEKDSVVFLATNRGDLRVGMRMKGYGEFVSMVLEVVLNFADDISLAHARSMCAQEGTRM